MRKLFTLVFLLLACVYLLPIQAQNTQVCNAGFQTVATGNVAKFYSANSAPTNPLIHTWWFGDNSLPDHSINPVHTYLHDGTYTVKHLVKDSLGTCTDTATKQVVITGSPCNTEIKFSYRVDSLGNCKKVVFQNLSTNNISPSVTAYYKWNFGDGTSSGDASPSHTYADTGLYNVCLVMEAGANCRKELCIKVAIKCTTTPPPPTCTLQIDFKQERDSLQANKLKFNSYISSNTLANYYKWSFGDGTTSTDANPAHVYQQPGTYHVCLVVEASATCRREICKDILVQFAPCNKPSFVWKKDQLSPFKIYFNNSTSGTFSTTKLTWKFGDGTTSNDLNPIHIYQQAGVYNVCLLVDNGANCIKDTCMKVEINNTVPPCINRSGFVFQQYAGNVLEFGFKPDSVNTTWKYYWNFGDGTTSNSFAASHKFPGSGVYKVCLTVISSNNCQTTTCKEIRIGAICDSIKVKFEVKRSSRVPNQLSFYAIGSQPLVKQRWTIYRSSTLAPVVIEAINPTYTFRDTGYYKVCLLATTANGCKKEYCDYIKIEKVITPSNGLITIFPNPTNSVINFEVKLERAEKIYISILNGYGMPVVVKEVNGVAGLNAVIIPVQQLQAGFYTVEIKYAGQIKLGRFQKI